ncbi:hypothetical protein K9L97_00670 [Candidatus Woesearchaeota archaeon]|nr:hypothetical protein [Candidatus Woesearchaeota archaeon]
MKIAILEDNNEDIQKYYEHTIKNHKTDIYILTQNKKITQQIIQNIKNNHNTNTYTTLQKTQYDITFIDGLNGNWKKKLRHNKLKQQNTGNRRPKTNTKNSQ